MNHLPVLIALSFSLAACQPLALSLRNLLEPSKIQEPQSLQHTVRYRGETLGVISSWYTGSSTHWREIAKQNPHIRPRSMQRGSVVSIPTHLIKKTTPLPRLAVRDAAQHTVRTTTTVAVDEQPPETLPLHPALTLREPEVEPEPVAAAASLDSAPFQLPTRGREDMWDELEQQRPALTPEESLEFLFEDLSL